MQGREVGGCVRFDRVGKGGELLLGGTRDGERKARGEVGIIQQWKRRRRSSGFLGYEWHTYAGTAGAVFDLFASLELASGLREDGASGLGRGVEG